MPYKQKKPLTPKLELINNTPKLIKLMEAKPLLWDTTDPDFYNLPERSLVWREITRKMLPKFDEHDEQAQKRMITQIKTRWRHVRTAYVRQKKLPNLRKSGYVYDKEMAFYSSPGKSSFNWFNGHKNGAKSSGNKPKLEHCESNDDELTDTELEHNESMKQRRIERKSRVKSKKINNSPPSNSIEEIFHEILIQESDASNADNDGYMYEYDGEDGEKLNGSNGSPNADQSIKLATYHSMEENSAMVDEDTEEDEQNNQSGIHPMEQIPANDKELHQEMEPVKPSSSRKRTADMKSYRYLQTRDIDDDECFFDSLKPALRGLNEDEKMDFRIEVMSILRDLKRK